MKAMVVSPVGGRVPPTRGVLHNGLGLNGGSGGGGGGSRRDMEAEEVAAYLTKLRSLVPDMPRKRKLSKLEVIQRVIEYICDLQTTLEETNVPVVEKTTSSPSSSTAGGQSVNDNCNIQEQLQPFFITGNDTPVTTNVAITSTNVFTTTTMTTTNEGSSVSYQR